MSTLAEPNDTITDLEAQVAYWHDLVAGIVGPQVAEILEAHRLVSSLAGPSRPDPVGRPGLRLVRTGG